MRSLTKRRAYNRAYRANHQEEIAAARRVYNAAHREERAVYRRAYYVAHDEEQLAAARAYYSDHREGIAAASRAYRAAHPERTGAATRAWALANPEKRSAAENVRRVRRLGNGGSHSVVEWLEKCALLGNVCLYCGETKPLTRDHKIPLICGGTDDITNIVPACRSCNSRKGRRTAAEFLASTPVRLTVVRQSPSK